MASGSQRHRAKVDERLRNAQAAAARIGDVSIEQIEKMSQASDSVARLTATVLLQRQVERSGSISSIIPTAKRLLSDGACRWQACVAIADGIPNEPEMVWPIIAEFGNSADADLRMAIATVLLEDLLNAHLATFFPLVRKFALAGNVLFLKTLSSCWFHGNPECERRVKNLLRTARRGRSG